MNVRPLLILLLTGCASPRKQEPPPPPPTACPLGHAELAPGPVGPPEVETFESSRPGPQGLVCGRCGYGCYPDSRIWTREAASLDGFANPPTLLLRRVRDRAPDATELVYRQTSAGSESSEWLSFHSRRDLWSLLREELTALNIRGSAGEKGSEKTWEGRLGERELKIYVRVSESGRSSFHAILNRPMDPAAFEKAFRRALTR